LSERFHVIARYRVSDQQEIDDIVQEALLAVAKKYASIDLHSGFALWAAKVLNNRILRYFRARQRRPASLDPSSDVATPAGKQEIDQDFRSRLLDCLAKVSARNRRHARILNLHYLGYTTEEICEKLELSRNGLYVILHRVRVMLKGCLDTGELK
jgi:RNA polymerase sigma-70 factor (ECF subfamily)